MKWERERGPGSEPRREWREYRINIGSVLLVLEAMVAILPYWRTEKEATPHLQVVLKYIRTGDLNKSVQLHKIRNRVEFPISTLHRNKPFC